jgi:hypothetical protein
LSKGEVFALEKGEARGVGPCFSEHRTGCSLGPTTNPIWGANMVAYERSWERVRPAWVRRPGVRLGPTTLEPFGVVLIGVEPY